MNVTTNHSPAERPGSAQVIRIRIPRDDELVDELLDKARLSGFMYATDGKHVDLVPRGLPGWREIAIGERRAAA